MKLLRKSLILSHRYLGIVLSLLIVMWFASGIVMMYAGGMPRLTPQLRLERLAALDVSSVRITPAEAAERAGTQGGRVSLLTVMDRPAYRFTDRGSTTVFADTGDVLDDVSVAQSHTIASRFMGLPEDQIHFAGTLTEIDQWTLVQRQMPLHKFRADDGLGTELYVAPGTADVTLVTTSRSRALAWMGTIPHWLYFTALRANQPLWYRIVVWTSALACVLSIIGLVLGITQFRRPKPFRLSAAIPYTGWMRWHYVTGVVFGIFTLTWAYSGLLSMEPFAWTNADGLEVERDVFTGGPTELSSFPAMDPVAWNRLSDGQLIKEVDFVRIQDEHYYLVRRTPDDPAAAKRPERLHQPYYVTGRAEPGRLLASASTLDVRREPFSVDSLMARLRTALPDVPIVDHEVLTEYDSYYYSRGNQTPLPVLRVRFADPAETWFYIDPEMSQMLAQVHRLNRVERWLYNGLHSLDFSFWYDRRPLWDIGMITLLLGGLASSSIGLFLGCRRLWRGLMRPIKSWTGAPRAAEPRAAPISGPALSRTEKAG